MDAVLSVLCVLSYALVKVYSVPPDICYEQFKWQDCGMHPKPVIYYYKSGSRCEVGMWRGCLPNNNMFEDEYDCVQTCIFSLRAKPIDYHKQQADNLIEYEETTTKTELPISSTGITAAAGDATATGDSGGDGAHDKGGEDTPADSATEEREAAADGGGDAPADGGEAPAENTDAPANGEVLADGEVPTEDAAPANGESPADGEAKPEEEPAPAE